MDNWRLLRSALLLKPKAHSNDTTATTNTIICTASSFHPFPDLMPRKQTAKQWWYRIEEYKTTASSN
jgi:hypothetical protein